jgi:hypothetical protein
MCRDKYVRFLNEDNPAGKIGPDPAEIKKINPLDDDPADSFPNLSDPTEFKDAPISFTLIVDGREEEIKVVEPLVDFPLPEGAHLMVSENELCLTDVVFAFKPESDRPYQLHFKVRVGGDNTEPRIKTFGQPAKLDEGFNSIFTERIIERGGVESWLEMTRGTARIFIRYKGSD